MTLARHVPHRGRRGPHPPAALGADDARHPHRHHRGVLTVGLGQGAQGRGARPDQRARHQPPRRLAGQHDRQHRRPRRLRLGVDADHRTTPPRSRRDAAAPDIAGGRRDVDDLRRRSTNGDDQLDDDAHRHHAELAGRCARAAVTVGPVPRPPTTRPTPRRSSCSAPTPRPSCSATGDPVGQTVTLQRHAARGDRRARGAQLVGATSNNDLAIVPLSHLRAAARRRHEPRLGAARSTSRRRRRTRCRPPTRRPNALLLNLHGITAATDADFSIATQESILSRPRPRSTRR